MPITPFIGVRISWLIFARNWDLARLAASAASLALFSSTMGLFHFCIGLEQFSGPLCHFLFEPLTVLLESPVPHLDLGQHLVESLDKNPDFIIAALCRPYRVILFP